MAVKGLHNKNRPQSHSAQAASTRQAATPPKQPSATRRARHARADDVLLLPEYDLYSRENYGSTTDYSLKRARKSSQAKKVALAIAAIIVAAVAALGIYALWFMNALDHALAPDKDQLESIDTQLVRTSIDEPFYTLILGSDSREGSGADDDVSYAAGQERSDVIMLARIDANARQITLVTIPRDTPYTMPDGTVVKINEVYNMGGVAASIEAVSQITGVGISHYVDVHISEMEAIVDSLGGIEVYVDRKLTVNDSLTGERIILQPGLQTLDGKQAQAFVRTRHAYSDTGDEDGHRQSNVRTFVQAVITKVLNRPITEIPGTVLMLAQYVTSDFTSADLITLATKFSGGKLTMYSCSGPTDGAEMPQYDGKWMCYPNPEGWAELMRQVGAGLDPGDIDYEATAIVE